MNTPAFALQITGVAFTGYPVTDIARARAFYEGVLALKSAAVFEHESRHWIEYDLGGSTLAISNISADKWKPSSDGPSLALEVADFDEAVAALRARAVPFALEPLDSGVCRLAVVSDPDGNSLIIHHRKPPA